MAAETPEPGCNGRQGKRPGWRQWLQVGALAVALLLISETLWLWQTWPVRELLHVAPVASPR